MSSPSRPSSPSSEAPHPPLHRANNLLTSHGRVVLQELADASDSSNLSSSPKKSSKQGFRASLKRKLKEVKARWDSSGGTSPVASSPPSPTKPAFHRNASSTSLPGVGRSRTINVNAILEHMPTKLTQPHWHGRRKAGHARSRTETEAAPAPPEAITNTNETRADDPPSLVFSPSTDSSPSSSSSLPSSGKAHRSLPPLGPQRSFSFTRLLLEDVATIQAYLEMSEQAGTDAHNGVGPPQEHGATGGKHDVLVGEVAVPEEIQRGTFITKVSNKKQKRILFSLDPDQGQIVWESKRRKIIPIEAIKEIRSGFDARFYREQFQLSSDYADRWMTIIYVLDGEYKTLHLIFATKEEFQSWEYPLRQMHAVRQELMNGLGHHEMREAMWEKQHWRSADEGSGDQKLELEEVLRLCKRLNINSSEEDLERWFKQADSRHQGFLDFDDFRKFVKYLKSRPEINRLFKKRASQHGDIFDWHVFERFMRDTQKSKLSQAELEAVFERYSSPSPSQASGTPPRRILTPEAFTTFLMSVDNSALLPDENTVWQDMTRPLSDYYISSSHNTYLVGHQLVGESTVEGYIRALLRGCRSVEVDIYDGDTEPMIFHGKTLTSKVSLREVCQAIAKYGFLTSPYPIIISAEVHCSIPQQDLIAEIMIKEFGDMLIQAPVDEKPKIDALPSPEELKGKIMLKAKNVYLARHDSPDDSSAETTASSASDTDGFIEIDSFGGTKKHGRKTPDLLPSRDSSKALSVLQRVRSVGKRKHAPSAPVPEVPSIPPIPTQPERYPSAPPVPSFVVTSRHSGYHTSREGSSTEEHPPPSPHLLPLSKPTGIPIPHLHGLSSADPWLDPTPFSLSPQDLTATEDVFGFSKANMFNGSTLAPPPSTVIPLALAPSSTSAHTVSTVATSSSIPAGARQHKMSHKLLTLLVYTVGVKCRGINKKEEYAPEHLFSLSENTGNKMMKSVGGGPLLDEKEHHSEDQSNGKPLKPLSGKGGMMDLIKHNRTHLTRIYPKGMRVNSTNYEPHRFWSAGCQLVALNWQTFDLGYTLNHAMFRRNGRCGYVLKPPPLRSDMPPGSSASGLTPSTHIPLVPPTLAKELLTKRTLHKLVIRVISAQQLQTTKEASADKLTPDPYVEVSLHVPEWPVVGEKHGHRKHKSHDGSPRSIKARSSRKSLRASRDEGSRSGGGKRAASRNADGMRTSIDSASVIAGATGSQGVAGSGPSEASPSPSNPTTSARTLVQKTSMVKNNGFNPLWEDELSFTFECVGDMKDLVFVKFAVKFGEKKEEKDDVVATFCASLASLAMGYRHLPLHDAELSQYLYSTLFVRMEMVDL